MGMISESQAKAILEPYHPVIHSCVASAWRRWEQQLRFSVALPSARYAANTMYELMVDEVRRQLTQLPGVTIIEGQRFLVGIGGLVLRFKKLNSALETSNYPTDTAMMFDAQLVLPGIPEGPRITVGYRHDRFWSRLLDVVVVASASKQVLWSYSVVPPAAKVIDMPRRQQQPAATESRVKAKKKLEKKSDKAEQNK